MIENYNLHKQLILSVETNIHDEVVEKKNFFGGHIRPLKVNRPFHHSLMRPATDNYHTEL